MSYNPLILKFNQFFGGVSDDIRKPSVNECVISKHFDIFSNPFRLTPYRSLEADTETLVSATDLKQYLIKDFFYATESAKLYGLGQTGAGLTKIAYKSDATTGNWTLPANSEGNGAVKNGCFFEYEDYAWGFQGTNQVFKWGLLSGTPTITNSVTTVAATITSVANGIIASDGSAYMAYNNTIVRIATGGTVTDGAKTVPSIYKITSLANMGSYIAIGCSPKSPYGGKSKVFIWDKASDLFNETVDWGEGDLRVLEQVEGTLIGVSDRYLNNSTGAGKGSMVIQAYNNAGSAQILKEIYTQALTGKEIPLSKTLKNNRLFWAAKIMTNSAGTEYNEGIWSFGRKSSSYPWALSLDIIDENIDTDGIQGFGVAANFFFIAHSNDGSIDKTNDTVTYAFTSTYESQKYDLGDAGLEKQLRMCTVYVSPLPASSSVTVKFKMDDDTSWTTIGSYSTEGGVSRDFYNIESSGTVFPSFKEIQIRFESLGGAEIVGYKLIANPMTGSN